MLNFPTFPDTLSTRQLECICCNEILTVSEDYATVTGVRTSNWQLVPDRFLDIKLRYQPERDRRTVTPPMRAEPNRNSGDFLEWSSNSKALVNCPRCGADNRNWLHILRSPQPWPQKFPIALLGYLAPAILGAIAFDRFRDLSQGMSNLILLLVSIFLVAHIPIQSSTRGWPKLREYHFAKPHTKSQTIWQSLPPPLRTGIISTGAFLILIPFLLYFLIPWGFNTAVNLLTTNNQQSLALKIDTLVNTLNTLSNDLQEEDSEKVKAAIGELDQLAKTTAANNASGKLPDWLPVNESFLKTWITHVLAAGIVGIALGWSAAASYERRIRPHLPRPIYYSIAAMTRVVVWEAKHALEIGDDVNQIQWTSVQRNHQGGIILQGLFRHNVSTGQTSDPLNTKVLAQNYEVISDRWGHIKEAHIKSARAYQRPYRSRQAMVGLGDELFGTVSAQAVEMKRP